MPAVCCISGAVTILAPPPGADAAVYSLCALCGDDRFAVGVENECLRLVVVLNVCVANWGCWLRLTWELWDGVCSCLRVAFALYCRPVLLS